jgi:hypothetical protein
MDYNPVGLGRRRRFSYEHNVFTENITMVSDGGVNLSHSSGRKAIHCGKTGGHPYTPIPTPTPTSLALALDRQHNNAWKWHIHT